jgi:hypothetical protein
VFLAACFWFPTASFQTVAAAEPVNVALGRPYAWSVAPNYKLCTDPGDVTQLTDGKLVDGYFWTQKGTVGWAGYNHVSVTIDLGVVQPIAGVAFHTAAGVAGGKWPRMLYVLVSDDGREFYPVADLVALQPALPPESGYRTFWYRSEGLETKGRYVRLLVSPGAGSECIFCDEIQVLRGDESFLMIPHQGHAFHNDDSFLTTLGCANRYRTDLRDVEKRLHGSRLNPIALADALAQCKHLGNELEAGLPETDAASFKGIIPFSDFHRSIFKLTAQALAADGFSGIVVWKSHRYAPMSLFENPSRQFDGLDVEMMDDEHRAEVLNLTNASDSDRMVQVQIRNLPGGVNPLWVKVKRLEWWDTREGVPILDPLIDLLPHNGWYEVDVPAGMTRQVWFAFQPQSLAPKRYKGELILQSDGLRKIVPLTLVLVPSPAVERPVFDLWMWDYPNGKGAYAVTPANRVPAIADLKRHGVTIPCATRNVLPPMDATCFDAIGNLVKPLNFASFDAWVREWPSARRYYVFWPVGPAFLKFKTGSPEFARAVSQWAKAWANHNRQIGLKPGQVIFHPVDEPGDEAKYQLFVEWVSAIRSGTNEIACFINPAGDTSPWKIKSGAEAMRLADLVSPALNRFLQDEDQLRSWLGGTDGRNKILALYSGCMPGVYDPTACGRLLPWIAYVHGATGLGLWSYADAPRTNCWNDYAALTVRYSPVFFDSDGVTDGKHWEAIQEGVEDYQDIEMLKMQVERALAEDPQNERAIEARKFLNGLDRDVIGRISAQSQSEHGDMLWSQEHEAMLLDETRLKALRHLGELSAIHG